VAPISGITSTNATGVRPAAETTLLKPSQIRQTARHPAAIQTAPEATVIAGAILVLELPESVRERKSLSLINAGLKKTPDTRRR
jgi:hypothetical protein